MAEEVEDIYAPIIDSNLTLPLALESVCSIANSYSLLVKGFRQASSILMRQEAKFVLIAKDNDPRSTEVINAICVEKKVPVIMIDTRAELGKIVGLTSGSEKLRVAPCGVAVLLDYGKNSEGKVIVSNAIRDIKNNKD